MLIFVRSALNIFRVNYHSITMEYFENNNEKDNPIIKTDFNLTINEQRHSTVISYINTLSVCRILDLGCNDGSFMQLVARSSQLEFLVGLDLDDSYLSTAISVFIFLYRNVYLNHCNNQSCTVE